MYYYTSIKDIGPWSNFSTEFMQCVSRRKAFDWKVCVLHNDGQLQSVVSHDILLIFLNHRELVLHSTRYRVSCTTVSHWSRAFGWALQPTDGASVPIKVKMYRQAGPVVCTTYSSGIPSSSNNCEHGGYHLTCLKNRQQIYMWKGTMGQ